MGREQQLERDSLAWGPDLDLVLEGGQGIGYFVLCIAVRQYH